jgi:hypothetical protein
MLVLMSRCNSCRRLVSMVLVASSALPCHRRQPQLAGRTTQLLRTQLAGRQQESLEPMQSCSRSSRLNRQGQSGGRGGRARRLPLWRCSG